MAPISRKSNNIQQAQGPYSRVQRFRNRMNNAKGEMSKAEASITSRNFPNISTAIR